MRSVEPPVSLSIGQLSRRTGVNVETIRYYERVRIVPVPPRTAGGRRVYGAAERRTLTFVRRARELGFTLAEIRTLLALASEDGPQSCAEVHDVAARHLAEIRAKIADLRAMEQVLEETVQRCEAGESSGCPVIETLSAG